jgi:hypothetical protein
VRHGRVCHRPLLGRGSTVVRYWKTCPPMRDGVFMGKTGHRLRCSLGQGAVQHLCGQVMVFRVSSSVQVSPPQQPGTVPGTLRRVHVELLISDDPDGVALNPFQLLKPRHRLRRCDLTSAWRSLAPAAAVPCRFGAPHWPGSSTVEAGHRRQGFDLDSMSRGTARS